MVVPPAELPSFPLVDLPSPVVSLALGLTVVSDLKLWGFALEAVFLNSRLLSDAEVNTQFHQHKITSVPKSCHVFQHGIIARGLYTHKVPHLTKPTSKTTCTNAMGQKRSKIKC
ncbi:hypothetical protein LXL04_035783 [Taraxacum kok-saghyz]